MTENIVAVPAALLHPFSGFELGRNADQQPGRIQELEAPLNLWGDQQLRKLVANPLHRDHGRL